MLALDICGFVCLIGILVALLKVRVFLGQPLHISQRGFILGFHVVRPGVGFFGAVNQGLDGLVPLADFRHSGIGTLLLPLGLIHSVHPVGAQLLIFFQNSAVLGAAGDLACSDLLHQFRRGAGFGCFVQQSGRLDVQNGLAVDFDAAKPLGDPQKVIGGGFAERDACAPCPEGIFLRGKLAVVQLLDNGAAQGVMGHRNGIDHPTQAGLGHLLALRVLILGHVKGIDRLSRETGVIKRGRDIRGCRCAFVGTVQSCGVWSSNCRLRHRG